ncbi:immunoglobulin superfamily member 23 isoform X1 [Ursus americanus]|uniref:immunoglobulin superfamily member 23 isoform X1 n=1 Tax=Ursus americanus TaxID=9643 RepID=UPI001E67DC73|nr:immunoglobulin superfamily member 23 isoform X1 [Ursus americanus]
MRCPLDAGPGHSPAWRRLLLTGILITSCACSASLELPAPQSPDPLTEGASARLPFPGSPNGVLSTSWFRGHKARQESLIFPSEGLPGPNHTSQEMLDTESSLIIGSGTAQDTVLETSRRRRSATEQIPGQASSNAVMLLTFPYASEGVIQSDLNYSVILECLASSITPKPVLHWTLNGEPYRTGSMLIIRKLSWEQLGTYVCTAKNSQGQYSSYPVTLSLPRLTDKEYGCAAEVGTCLSASEVMPGRAARESWGWDRIQFLGAPDETSSLLIICLWDVLILLRVPETAFLSLSPAASVPSAQLTKSLEAISTSSPHFIKFVG